MPPLRKRAIRKVTDRYELREVIGRGGMGLVYRAYDTVVKRDVALKTLRESPDPVALELFRKECGVLASLSHPNIIEIFDIGELEGQDGSRPYFVMPLLPGATLDTLIHKERPRLSVERCLEIIGQTCRGVQAAHERGIIHRDIKPSNIFVLEDDSVKIIDFGVTHMTDTRTTMTVRAGTLSYMAPEQVQSREVSPLSDLFSLGVVLYETLTGRHPFTGGSEAELVEAITRKTPPPVWEVNAAVNETIGRCIQKSLAKERRHRFASVKEFAESLEKARRNEPVEIFNPVRRQIEEGEHQRRIRTLHESALRAWQRGDLETAVADLQNLLELEQQALDDSTPQRRPSFETLYNEVCRERDAVEKAYQEARNHMANGRLSMALGICRQYLAKYSDHGLFQALRFDIEERQRQETEARIAELERRAEGEPDLDRKVLLLQEAADQFKGEGRVERAFQLACEMRDLVNAIAGGARRNEQAGQLTEALGQWEVLRSIYPEYPGLEREIQRLTARDRQQAPAAPLQAQAREAGPKHEQDIDRCLAEARQCGINGDLEGALARVEQGLALCPEEPRLRKLGAALRNIVIWARQRELGAEGLSEGARTSLSMIFPNETVEMGTKVRADEERPAAADLPPAFISPAEGEPAQNPRRTLSLKYGLCAIGAAAAVILMFSYIFKPKANVSKVPTAAPSVSEPASSPSPLRTTSSRPARTDQPAGHSTAAPPATPNSGQPQPAGSSSAAGRSVAIDTRPPNALVTLDDGQTCTSPCAVTVAPGRHAMEARLEGYRNRNLIFHAPSQHLPSQVTVSIDLVKQSGTLFVIGPAGAEVILDGAQTGKHTGSPIAVAPGRHIVELQGTGNSPGYSFEIQDGEMLRVDLSSSKNTSPK